MTIYDRVAYTQYMRKFALFAAVGFVLAGCGGSKTASGPAPAPHYPSVVHSPLVVPGTRRNLRGAGGLKFAQLVSPTRLAIVTWGSGSCPAVPDELVVQSRHAIRINLVLGSWTRKALVAHPPRPNGICTDDRRTTRMVVAIDPKRIDVHHSLTVSFFYYKGKKPQVWTAAPLNG